MIYASIAAAVSCCQVLPIRFDSIQNSTLVIDMWKYHNILVYHSITILLDFSVIYTLGDIMLQWSIIISMINYTLNASKIT